jgi:ribosome-associated toxin RatA of RatAB toxin-antitoxin module
MKHVKRSVLLWYSPREMYELVTAVEQYPAFLPWCAGAEVIERHVDGVTARLTLSKGGLRHAFTTRNRHELGREDGAAVRVALVDGPFSDLEGTWQFLPVSKGGEARDADAAACRIEFDLRYAFANVALEALVSPVFDRVANTLVDSFVQRAEQVHGPR